MRAIAFCLTGIVLTALLTGCTVFDKGQTALRQTVSMFRPNTGDYRDGTEDETDDWASVGIEGRAGQDRQVDPDPWFRQHFMSAKARHIENNLGVE